MRSVTKARSTLGVSAVLAALTTIACCGSGVAAASTASRALVAQKTVVPARFSPAMAMSPHYRPAVLQGGGSTPFACQQPPVSTYSCYGPDQIRAAYGIQSLLDHQITGAGRTIVIIDAFSPTGVRHDLETFDAAFGLPNPALRIVAPQGATPFDPQDPEQQFWDSEIDLDVQWSHVVAPQAKIVLVEARSSEDPDIADAVSYAVDHQLGDVISQSFAEQEKCAAAQPGPFAQLRAAYAAAAKTGITVLAATGDWGAGQFVCDETSNNFDKAVGYPASDPNVLGVGGTRLNADLVSGAYHSETAWNDGSPGNVASSGGGYSTLFARPAYQSGAVAGPVRGVPDVAYSASADRGLIIYWGQDGGTGNFYEFGGTSIASPQWAALIALADQKAGHRLGLVNPTLYAARTSTPSLFHDIAIGNNSIEYTADNGSIVPITGFQARPGWDPVTGLGTPQAPALVSLLAKAHP